MTLPFTTHEVVFLRAPVVEDAHGNKSRRTKDWAHAFRSAPVSGVAQPDAATLGASLATRENRRGGGEQIETTMRVWVNGPAVVWVDPPSGADTDPVIKPTDGVEIDGLVYDIKGDPLPMNDPFGGLSHLVMKATRVRG